MAKPIVAVVGRPNVGKSTIFNYLIGNRTAIVDDTPGVTRDRIYGEAEWRGRNFMLVDTGGIEPVNDDYIYAQMRRQSQMAMDMADCILFVVDGKAGLTSDDEEVAQMLRRCKKPVVVCVNKVDSMTTMANEMYEFYSLGFDDLVCISAVQALGIGDMLDEIYKYFPDGENEEDESLITKVAVVGKPNVGKSSLINRLLGEDRMIVANMPGTTRDAIDSRVSYNGHEYVFIDTAGIRKQNKIDNDIEWYSTVRSWAAIDRADVVLIMIDAVEKQSEQDTKIAGYAHEKGKACIFIVNKWDAVEKETGTMKQFTDELYRRFPFMTYAPVLFISALTGQRVPRLYQLIDYVADQATIRATTGMLNSILADAVAMVQPPSDKGRRLKIYYITQVGVKPPQFAIFVNSKKLFHFSYERYIKNQLRKNFGFEGSDLVMLVREKSKGEDI